MKKLSYFIPHLILVALLVNKEIINKKQTENFDNLRSISSLSEENYLLKGSILLNTQSPEEHERNFPGLSLLNEKSFNQPNFEEPGKKNKELSLSKESNIPSLHCFDLNVKKCESYTENLIKKLTAHLEISENDL